MFLRRRRNPRHARRGVAAVECALLLPLLGFAFVATVDFCRVFYYSVTVSNCARNGAVYACADWAHATDANGIAAAARMDAHNLDAGHVQVASFTHGTSSVAVCVSYPFTTIAAYPGVPRTTSISRTVRARVVPATPTFQ
jgi:Flp pilus assembly protein TadG